MSSANIVTNVPTVAINQPVGARLHQFREKWEALGSSPKVVTALGEGYTLPLRFRPSLTRSPTVISNYVNPQRQSHLLEALFQLVNKNAVEPVANQNSLGFYNRLLLVPKPNNRWRPILDLNTLNTFLNTVLQNGDSRDNKNLPTGRGVGHLHRLQGHILPHTYSQSVQEVHEFSLPGSVLPVQSPTLWSVHGTHGVHSGGQRGQTDGFTEGYKNPPVPRRLVGESHVPPNLSPAYSDPSSLSRTRLAGEQGEVRTGSKTGFQLRRLPVRPQGGQGQTHTSALADFNQQDPVNPVRSHSVALEEQLESTTITRKGDTCSQITPPPPTLVAGGKQRAPRSTITPNKTYSADIYRRIKEGWGAHLNERTARGTWSIPESKLHVNHLELKAVFLALKEFQDLCCSNIVLVATDNTTVVAYINKEGGMKLGSLCTLLWRILSWCTRKQVNLRACHIPGRLNMIAVKLSRLGQTIQREWSLHPEVFQAICSWWHQPQVDLFATRFNNKIPQFVSPVPDPQTWAMDALSLSWEDLNPYAFPPVTIFGKVVVKLQDYPCNRIILIAPGWPNMPWFWDLVAMSSQIPLCLPNLPNLVSQPFNQTLHRNLPNLNLHAWLLEPQQSRSRASLRQWQHELRLLKEDQPDPSMRQSGPFLQRGASAIRWTSGHHL